MTLYQAASAAAGVERAHATPRTGLNASRYHAGAGQTAADRLGAVLADGDRPRRPAQAALGTASWTMRLPELVRCAVLGTAILTAAACGRSTQERKLEVIRCSAYVQASQIAMLVRGPATTFVRSSEPMLTGHPAADRVKIVGFDRLGDQLAGAMDRVQAVASVTDGAKLWNQHLTQNDAAGRIRFLDECVANYDALLKAGA